MCVGTKCAGMLNYKNTVVSTYIVWPSVDEGKNNHKLSHDVIPREVKVKFRLIVF